MTQLLLITYDGCFWNHPNLCIYLSKFWLNLQQSMLQKCWFNFCLIKSCCQ